MWPFKKKRESPAEIAAEEKLDEATREVAEGELEKESAREAPFFLNPVATLAREGLSQPPLHEDPDPSDDRSMHDVMHEDDAKP